MLNVEQGLKERQREKEKGLPVESKSCAEKMEVLSLLGFLSGE